MTGSHMRAASGPRGWPFLGVLPALRSDLLGTFTAIAHRYGDVAAFKLGRQPAFLVTHPGGVKHVYHQESRGCYGKRLFYPSMKLAFGEGLLVSDGALWQRQRRLLQPFFTKSAVGQWHGILISTTDEFLKPWKEKARHPQPIDISKEMLRLLQEITVRLVFGSSLPRGNVDPLVKAIATINANLLRRIFGQMVLNGALNHLPTPENRRFRAALDKVHATVADLMKRRQQGQKEPADLFSALLAVRDAKTGAAMAEQQLRDELVTLFLASQDTTANALGWTFYHLSQNPDITSRLQTELDVRLAGHEPSFEDLSTLPYTRSVIEESLRLSPPAYAISRTALDDDLIDGYRIPKKSLVVLSPYVTQRDPRFWTTPETFDPKRFTPERARTRPRYAYFPFGGGQRTCLGKHLALMAMTTIVAMVLQRYRLRLVPGHPVVPQTFLTLRPKYGIQVTLEQR